MSFYNKILLPIDLSERSSKVVPHIKEIADKFDAEVHILYVAHVTQYYDGLDLLSAYVFDFETEVIKGADKLIGKFLDENFNGQKVKAKVVHGHPGEEILNYVQSEGIDLIIMGHSKKGIKRVILGSVAGHVVKGSHIPVLVVNPDETEQKEED